MIFDSSRHKVARAKHHVNDLINRVDRFKSEHPYEIVVEEDSEPGYKIHKFRLLAKAVDLVPISVIIGDVVTNLRAALDHSIYACAIVSGKVAPKFRTCSFPFGDTMNAFENGVNGCTSVPQEIRACLSRFQAYKGGNQALWALNSMCNWDKHSLITPVVMGWESLTVQPIVGEIEQPNRPFWDSAKNEIELLRTKGNPHYDYALTLEVAFDGSSALPLQPIIPTVNIFGNIVEGILAVIEAEMRRLFPSAFS